MSAQWFLLAAQAGTNILQSQMQRRAASAQAELGTARAELAGSMERIQIRRAAEADARQRTQRLAETVGSQRAAMGAAGVGGGGRTARLMRMRTQVKGRHEQDQADMQRQMQEDASRFRERSQISDMRAQARQARTQANLDLLGGGLSLGQDAMALREQQQAQG